MNNDFGKVYDAGFRAYVAQSPTFKDRVEFVTETIEPQAPTVTDPMTTLASKNPDVFIAMTAGTRCTQAVIEAAQNGMKESVKYLFQPLTCTGVSFVTKEKVGGDGSASDGWWIFNPGIKDIKDESLAEDPWMVFAKGLLTAKGIDPTSSSSLGAGFGYAWPFVQTLLIAQELDGGLTRANLIVAHRSLDMTPAHPPVGREDASERQQGLVHHRGRHLRQVRLGTTDVGGRRRLDRPRRQVAELRLGSSGERLQLIPHHNR